MGDDESDSEEYSREERDADEAERRKREVGRAPYGSSDYCRNAAYILRSYSNPNSETREKLRELERRGY